MVADKIKIRIVDDYAVIPVTDHKIHLHAGDDVIFLDTDPVLMDIVQTLTNASSVAELRLEFENRIPEPRLMAFLLELRKQNLAELVPATRQEIPEPETNPLALPRPPNAITWSAKFRFRKKLAPKTAWVIGEGANRKAAGTALRKIGFGSVITLDAERFRRPTINPEPDTCDVAVVALDSFQPSTLQTINRFLVSNRIPIVYGAIEGQTIRLGPTVLANTGGCLRCYISRLVEHNPYLFEYEGFDLPRSRNKDAVKWLGLALAAEAADTATGGTGSDLVGRVLSYRLSGGNSTSEQLIPLFDCPDCAERWARIENPPLRLTRRLKRHTADGGHRTLEPARTVARFKHLIGRLGIVASLRRIDDTNEVKLPVYASYSSANEASSGLRKLRLHCGKGVRDDQSKASAILEAIERYSANATAVEPVWVGTWNGLKDKGYSLQDLTLPSYKNCAQCKKECSRFHADLPIEWVWGTSLGRSRQLPIPANLIFHRYHPRPDNSCRHFLPSDSNGLAAGNNLEEAVFHAACEVIERDAVTLLHRARGEAFHLHTDATRNPLVSYAIEEIERHGLELHFRLLPQGALPTMLVVLIDHNGERPYYATGSSSHTDPELALLRSLTEANHVRIGIRWESTAYGYHPDERRFDLEQAEALLRSSGEVRLSQLPDLSCEDISSDIELITRRLLDLGSDLWVYNLTRPGIDVPVVRVVCPGLQPGDMFPCLRPSLRLQALLETTSPKNPPRSYRDDFLW